LKQSLRTLLEHLVDYAGLFPPAGLTMEKAASNYASYLAGPHQWMLGRFVVPVARLEELVRSTSAIAPITPWPLTVLTGADPVSDLNAAASFDARYKGRFTIEAAEVKIADLSQISSVAAAAVDGLEIYFETASEDLEPFISAVGEVEMRGKMRTGGLTPDAIPDAVLIARFIELCSDQDVPFKATAGLHHPIRCDRPLTYEPDAQSATMHGFVNLFLAAALLYDGAIDSHHAERLLRDGDPGNYRFDDRLAHWLTAEIDVDSIEAVRHNFAISFGSCSFEEPLDDLRQLGWM
jgi:hypothetical protein